jgi:hypothetical protein
MHSEGRSLDQKILSILERGVERPLSDGEFDGLALEIFRHQFKRNKPYQKYCRQLGKILSSVNHWSQIPFVPVSAFKETPLCCFPAGKAKKVFWTSGTTQRRPGRHYLENLSLYEKSSWINFLAHFQVKTYAMPVLILTPSTQEMPHSSLCHMFHMIHHKIGTEKNPFYMHQGKILARELAQRLRQLCRSKTPVLLLGTAFSFVHFLNEMSEKKYSFTLPEGSKIMETGGYKGKSREVPKNELYAWMQKVFHIPDSHIINEYGMTEMGSQFYDNCLFRGRSQKRHKNIPPWVKTRILNPFTLKESKPGEMGLLQHYDLANRSSLIGLLTEDIGLKIENGFEILGRSPSAESRGCSITLQEWMRQNENP